MRLLVCLLINFNLIILLALINAAIKIVNKTIKAPKQTAHALIPLAIEYISVPMVLTLPPTNLVIIKSSKDIAKTMIVAEIIEGNK